MQEQTRLQTVTGQEYMQVCWSPYRGSLTKPRRPKYQSTARAQAKGNDRRAHDWFIKAVIDNFYQDDFFVTVTFPPEMPNTERIHKAKCFIERVKYLYLKKKKYNPDEFRYIKVWGRGEECENLHMHFLIPRLEIEKFEIIEKQQNLNVDVKKIKKAYPGNCEKDVLESCANYLWQHYSTLEQEDMQLITTRYYSHNLRKVSVTEKLSTEHNLPNEQDPQKQLMQLMSAQDDETIDSYIRQWFKGYRCSNYVYGNRHKPWVADEYGQIYCKLDLVKIGSRLDDKIFFRFHYDEKNEKVEKYKIDSTSGEVLEIVDAGFDPYQTFLFKCKNERKLKILQIEIPQSRAVYTGAYRHHLNLEKPIIQKLYRKYLKEYYQDKDKILNGQQYKRFEDSVFKAMGYTV